MGDALADAAIAAACDELRAVAAQMLDYAEEEDVLLDCDGSSDTLLLPECPVHAVTSFTMPVAGSDPITFEEGVDFVLDKELGAIRTKRWGRTWLPGRQIYSVDYSHGFLAEAESGLPDVPVFPTALKVLAATLAARIYDQTGVAQESVGGYTATFSSAEALTLTVREHSLLENLVGIAQRRR